MTDVLRSLEITDDQRASPSAPTGRWRSRTRWLALLAAGACAAGAATWWTATRSKPAPAHEAAPTSSVAQTRGGHLAAGGYVRHARVVNVVPRVSGIVATLRVSEGEIVHQGDILATIEPDDLQHQAAESRAELRAAQARLAELAAGARREELASARAQVDALRLMASRLDRDRSRSSALAESGAISLQVRESADSESLAANKNLEAAQQSLALLEAGTRPEKIASARAAVDAARARLARVEELLRRTEIRAPLDGRVLRKFVEVGSTVSYGNPYVEGSSTLGPGSPILAIGQLQGLEATADINQTDLGRISLGEKVEIRADAFPGQTYQAIVARFSARADRNKNTVEVTVRFDEPAPLELAHDMSVKLSFLGADRPIHPDKPERRNEP